MKLPCMVIIFNKEMSDKLPVGIKCAFAAHAAMWMCNYTHANASIEFYKSKNEHGEFGGIIGYPDDDFIKWLDSDYRKLVMVKLPEQLQHPNRSGDSSVTSPDTIEDLIEDLFEKFKKAEVPVYMQKTSHDIRTVGGNCKHNNPDDVSVGCACLHPDEIFKSGTPITLAVFLWKDEHKKLLEGMELL